jgi:hypothetical protein
VGVASYFKDLASEEVLPVSIGVDYPVRTVPALQRARVRLLGSHNTDSKNVTLNKKKISLVEYQKRFRFHPRPEDYPER